MRRAFQLICMVLITGALVAAASCTSQPDAPVAPPAAPPSGPVQKQHLRIVLARLEKLIHDRVNRERRRHGLPTMRWDDALGRIAGKHSLDMATRNYFGHTSPEGYGYSYRYRKNGYACGITVNGVLRSGAENIFQVSRNALVPALEGEPSQTGHTREVIAESTLKGWMDNPEDRKNILSPHWEREGIGISVGPDDTIYITQNFC